MSALPPKADIERHDWHVRFVPKAAVSNRSKAGPYSITSSAATSRSSGNSEPAHRSQTGSFGLRNVTSSIGQLNSKERRKMSFATERRGYYRRLTLALPSHRQ